MFLNSNLKKTIFLCGELNQKNSDKAVSKLKSQWPQYSFNFISTHTFESNSKIEIFKYSIDSLVETTSMTFPEFLKVLSEEIFDNINQSRPDDFSVDFNILFALLPKGFSNEAMEIDCESSVEIFKNILTNNHGKKYFSKNCARIPGGYDPMHVIHYGDLQLFDEFILRMASNRNDSPQAFKNIFQLSARVLS